MADCVTKMAKRATCFAAFATIIQTYDTAWERLALIHRLRDAGIISPMSADLMVEEMGLAAV